MTRPCLAWIPRALLVTLAVAPFAIACDLSGLEKKEDAAVLPLPPAATATATAVATVVADPNAAPPTTGASAGSPLGVAPVPTVHPATLPDGGHVAVDAGAHPATPVTPGAPTFQIPTAIPGFDAGAFKPPPGFPTAIPTTFPTIPPPHS